MQCNTIYSSNSNFKAVYWLSKIGAMAVTFLKLEGRYPKSSTLTIFEGNKKGCL